MRRWLFTLTVAAIGSLIIAACGGTEVVEVIKEVPVRDQVIKEVVTEVEVPVEKVVVKEVRVVETVVVEKEVAKEVERVVVKEVPKEVVKEVEVKVVETVVVEREVVKEKIVVATPVNIEAMVTGEARYGGILRIVSQSSIKSLDAQFAPAYVTGAITRGHLFEALFAQGADFSANPVLVDKWTISDDGLDWTFTLRSGLKFHDGQALTTADVIPSMDRVLVGPAQGEVLQLFLTEDKWSVQDALNFTIHTVEPYGGMLDGLALVIVGDTTIYKGSVASAFVKGEDVGEENILGTGPYKLAKWEVGNKVELLRYEDFVSRTEPASWHAGEKKAYVDGMTWFEIPSEETKIAGLKTGEWDFVDSIGLDFVKSLQQDDNIKFTFYPGHRWYMGFNTSEAPLDNNTVRLAIQAALDSEAMMQTLGPQETWSLGCSIYGSGTVYDSDAGCENYNQNDIPKAQGLLADAGYDGEEITILNPTDYATITPVGPVVKARLEDIGMTVSMPGMDWATTVGIRVTGEGWHLFSSWGTIALRQSPALSFILAGGGKAWGFGWYDAKMDEIHQKFLRATTQTERQNLADQAQAQFFSNPSHVYAGTFFMPSPMRSWVYGHPPEHPGYPNFNNVWIHR